jgi:hypothetical protein
VDEPSAGLAGAEASGVGAWVVCMIPSVSVLAANARP